MFTLYTLPYCPFCEKVERFFREEEVAYTVRDIATDASAREHLFACTGKTQVPYLEDSERAVGLLESEDIIAYVREKKKTCTPAHEKDV